MKAAAIEKNEYTKNHLVLQNHGAVTKLKAAELLVRCLENEDVKYAFGIPGEENLDLMDAIHDSAIRFIPTRHEGAAAFMADFYGRMTGDAGVCLSVDN